MGYVPADILFLDKPRIQGIGYCWMPTTFLGMGNDSGMSFSNAAKPTIEGLLVELPGIVIQEPFMPLDLGYSSENLGEKKFTHSKTGVFIVLFHSIQTLTVPRSESYNNLVH